MIPVRSKHNDNSDFLWGYIDSRGRWLILPRFKAACFFSSRLALVKKDESDLDQTKSSVGFINPQGRWAIPPMYFDSLGFWDGCAPVAVFENDAHLNTVKIKWGMIDKHNKFIINPLYDFVGHFMGGLARACDQGKWGYINRREQWVVPPTFDWAGDIIEGVARVQRVKRDLETTYIRIAKEGCVTTVNSTCFNQGEDFVNGLAAVLYEGKYGYIDREGQWILRPIYLEAGDYANDRMPVLTSQGWHLINSQGASFSRYYEELTPMHEGLSRFLRDGRWGFIDKTGKEVITNRFEQTEDFCDGHAFCTLEGKLTVINSKGESIWTDGAF